MKTNGTWWRWGEARLAGLRIKEKPFPRLKKESRLVDYLSPKSGLDVAPCPDGHRDRLSAGCDGPVPSPALWIIFGCRIRLVNISQNVKFKQNRQPPNSLLNPPLTAPWSKFFLVAILPLSIRPICRSYLPILLLDCPDPKILS